MNDFVRQKSGRPVTAMVLDQFPITGDRGQQITRIAEEAAPLIDRGDALEMLGAFVVFGGC
jgi:hypothetical protein